MTEKNIQGNVKKWLLRDTDEINITINIFQTKQREYYKQIVAKYFIPLIIFVKKKKKRSNSS